MTRTRTEPNPGTHRTRTEPNPINEGSFPSLIKTAQQRTIIQLYVDCYTDRRWAGCYIWYIEEGPGRAAAALYQLRIIPSGTLHSKELSGNQIAKNHCSKICNY